MQEHSTTTDRVPYMLGRAIETLKQAVPIEQVARHYGEFKLAGNGRLLGHCLALGHEDRTPSLTVFTDTQRFKCFGCGLGGDVIDLEELGGRHLETWTAIIALSERFRVELPRRPERWHQWTNEKFRRRQAIRDALATSYQRRFFRVYGGHLEHIEDPEERKTEAHMFWDDLRPGALAAAENRMSR